MSGGGKETPRQKMIGMMYLFYTALLALNVSAEVLAAFQLVDQSLRKTNDNTMEVIQSKQAEFAKAMVNDSLGVLKWKQQADRVINGANAAFDAIQAYKDTFVVSLEIGLEGRNDIAASKQKLQEIAREADGGDEAGARPAEEYPIEEVLTKKDDNNVGGQVFIQEGDGVRGKAVQTALETYRELLIDVVNQDKVQTEQAKASRETLIKNIESTLFTGKFKSGNKDMDSIPWPNANFEHLPAAGVITLMTKMQSDIRNLESAMMTHLLGQIGKTDMKFNAIKAVVNAPNSYVLVGGQYKAEVFIAAYDSTENPDMVLNGGGKLPVSNGVGTYTATGSAVGPKSWGGVIKLKNKSTGEIKDYPFKAEYEVGQSSVSVSPTKMNVFYIGVPNPVEVTASGIPAEKLHVGISQGSITKSGNGYVVNVKTPGTVKINVSANVDGQTKTFPAKEFRVKRVPDPKAAIGSDPKTKYGGIIQKAILSAQPGVKAEMENFDFDLKFQVTSYTVSATIKGFTQDVNVSGPNLTPAVKQLIGQVPSGGKIYFENIKAKGPDGSIRDLGSISYKLK